MSKIPRGQHSADTKKAAHRNEMKEAATATNALQKDGVLKQKENIMRKNVAHRVYKGVSTRYDMQEQLKEQNQQLMAANEELQKNLAETRQRVTHLEQQFCALEKENSEVEKNLKDCQILLVAAKIDPISGDVVGEAARQDEEQRKEVMSISTDLLKELKHFSEMASQQRSHLQEIQKTMTDLSEARQHMLQEREAFSVEAAEMEKALTEAEALLL
ncbi:small kinetochore-associated protein isoform X2 [Dunckerocampus dactyliophorus]|uniref:small kinetochore-associated protein isoform X2 n=1 Tax=Dunckerocampus dactyliophorus TaxID=161453 RepID=UPI002406D08A|nr:small kinetochore-associated protein isoform X2 [Dunckerocampus dactyliophorus]